MTGSETTLARTVLDAPIAIITDSPVLPIFDILGGRQGLIRNACSVLRLWPTGLRTAQLLASGLLDLPLAMVRRTAPNDLTGLAMYASSCAAKCDYTAAHAATYAIARGIHPAAIAGRRLPRERAAAEFATAIISPSTGDAHDSIDRSDDLLHADELTAITAAVGFMGFLNKFCDAMGLELESDAAGVVIDLRSRLRTEDDHSKVVADDWRRALQLARVAPATALLERQWLSGIPNRAPLAIRRLERTTGISFEILLQLASRHAMRAVAAVLRDNLEGPDSYIPAKTKALAALVFGVINDAPTLVTQAQRAVCHRDATTSNDLFEAVRIFALECPATPDTFMLDRWLDRPTVDVLLLARAIAPTPALTTPAIVDRARESLSASAVIELVVWLSIQQMLAYLETGFATRST